MSGQTAFWLAGGIEVTITVVLTLLYDLQIWRFPHIASNSGADTPSGDTPGSIGSGRKSGGLTLFPSYRRGSAPAVKWWLHRIGFVFGVVRIPYVLDVQNGLGLVPRMLPYQLAPLQAVMIFLMYSTILHFNLMALYKQIRAEPPRIARYLALVPLMLLPFGIAGAIGVTHLNRLWPHSAWLLMAAVVLDVLLFAAIFVYFNLRSQLKQFLARLASGGGGSGSVSSIDTSHLSEALHKLTVFFVVTSIAATLANSFLLPPTLTNLIANPQQPAVPDAPPTAFDLVIATPVWAQTLANLCFAWYSWHPLPNANAATVAPAPATSPVASAGVPMHTPRRLSNGAGAGGAGAAKTPRDHHTGGGGGITVVVKPHAQPSPSSGALQVPITTTAH